MEREERRMLLYVKPNKQTSKNLNCHLFFLFLAVILAGLICFVHSMGDESGGLADIIKCICIAVIPPKCDKCPLKRYEFTLLWP